MIRNINWEITMIYDCLLHLLVEANSIGSYYSENDSYLPKKSRFQNQDIDLLESR